VPGGMDKGASGGSPAGSDGQGSVARVAQAASAAGLDIEIVRMGRPTRTAAEAAAACGVEIAQIVKSLVFRLARGDGAEGEPVLLLVAGDNRVDEARVGAALGGRLSRMSAAEVRDATGFAIGGVAPLGGSRPLPVYIDADLLSQPRVFAAAGAPDAVFGVEPRALAAATGAPAIAMG